MIPFASYGTEDMVDVLFDIPLTSILGREMYLPIPKPPAPSQIQVSPSSAALKPTNLTSI